MNIAQLSRRLITEIKKRSGFEPQVLILGFSEIEKAIAKSPFPEAEGDPSRLHLGFLADLPKNPDLKKHKGDVQIEHRLFILLLDDLGNIL